VIVTDGGTINVGATDTNNDPSTGILARTWNTLTVNTGAKVAFAPATTTVTRNVLAVTNLSNSGTIDLSSNDLIASGAGETGYGTINSQVAAGRGTNGQWTGAGSSAPYITSSAAAASPTNMALAVVVNDTNQSPTGTLSGTSLLNSFDNVSVNDGDVLVKYTYYGDATLTGSVTSADYLQIDNAFNNNSNVMNTPLTGWYNGDFNYDGVINGDDYTLIDNAFNSQGSVSFAGVSAGPAEMIAYDTDQIAGSDVVATPAVPEPATFGLLAISALATLQRRRRKIFRGK
jgi:hypothetical protein